MSEKKVEYFTVPRCRRCGIALLLVSSCPKINPQRRYCSNKCRQAAYRARKKGLQRDVR